MVSAMAADEFEPANSADRKPTAPREMLVDPRFIRLADQFFGMFSQPARGGGALTVYLDGRPVVDIWAGWADKGRRWNRRPSHSPSPPARVWRQPWCTGSPNVA